VSRPRLNDDGNEKVWWAFFFFKCKQLIKKMQVGVGLGQVVRECSSVLKVTGSNPSGGSESTFCSDLLLTAKGSSTWALFVVACLLCYLDNTLCCQHLEPPGRTR
jgi:hypothetical protein